ncbi:MAG TPA: hypothetical protein VFH58_06250, partial [Acidimicrobiales bacterium]|nr:hypothetical protein [Acidimicrobiales bacterium]
EGQVNSQNFLYQLGLSLVLIVYIWGISSPTGALLGALSLSVGFPQIQNHLSQQWASVGLILTGFGAISLGRNPNGTIGLFSDTWKQASRVLAGRRGAGSAHRPQPAWAGAGDPYQPAGLEKDGEVKDLVPAADR